MFLAIAYVMANERADELESQLSDGRLCVRDFIRGLAKTEYTSPAFLLRYHRIEGWS